jgi:hypothetical protein
MRRNRITTTLAHIGILAVALPLTTRAEPLPEAIPGKAGPMLANGGFDIGDGVGRPIAWDVEGNAGGVTSSIARPIAQRGRRRWN